MHLACGRVLTGPKIVASTATTKRARQQVRAVFGRELAVFPPLLLDISDTFFSRQVPVTPKTPGRRYLGICAHGVRLKSAEIRLAEILLIAGQTMFDSYGPAADPYMTVVGYFNATRELAGMRRYLDDDVTTRVRSHGRPRGLADRIASSAGMLAIEELTSRISSAEISNVLKRLEAGFSADLDTSVRRRAILAETADALKNKRDGQSVADVSRPGPGADDAKDQLAEFSRRCSGVRLVYDAWTSRVTEVAVRDPQTWTWQVIPVGTPAERQFRQIALSLLTAAVAPVTSQVVGPPSSLDNALGALAPVLSPAVILAKLCNVAVQAAAHHIMPGPFAPVLGAAAEKTVTQWAVSVSPLGKVSDAAQNIDVVLDVANDQFTPNVRDLALDKVADRIMEKRLVISPAELRKLIAEDSGDLKPPFQRPGPADPGRWDGPRWPGGI